MTRHRHHLLSLETERDGCFWVRCMLCTASGPKKHTQFAALVAFALTALNQHPRRPRKARQR